MYKLVQRYDWLWWRAIWAINVSRGPGGVFGARLEAGGRRERDLTHITRRQSAPWLYRGEGRGQRGGELWKLPSLFLSRVLRVRDALSLLWGRGGAGGGRRGGGEAGMGGECVGTKLPIFCWRAVGLRGRHFKLQGGNWDRNGNKWQTEGEKSDSDENQRKDKIKLLKKKQCASQAYAQLWAKLWPMLCINMYYVSAVRLKPDEYVYGIMEYVGLSWTDTWANMGRQHRLTE